MASIPLEVKPEDLRNEMAETERDQKSLTIVQEKRLSTFAPDVNEIVALAARFKMMLTFRGAADLNRDERIALASAALTYDLNPALGELWYVKSIGLMVGHKGWVKKLDELAQRENFKWWPRYRMLQNHEYAAYNVPIDAKAAYVCEIRRSDWLKVYTDTLQQLGTAGLKLDYEMIVQILGTPPMIEGVGIIHAKEDFGNNRMALKERCEKRAFGNCCRQFVSLPFAPVADGDVIAGKVIDGVAVEKHGSSPMPEIGAGNEGQGTPDSEQIEEGEIVETTLTDAVAAVMLSEPATTSEPPTTPQDVIKATEPPTMGVPFTASMPTQTPAQTPALHPTAISSKPAEREMTPKQRFNMLRTENPDSMGAGMAMINKQRANLGLGRIADLTVRKTAAAELGIPFEGLQINQHWTAITKAAEVITVADLEAKNAPNDVSAAAD